MTERGKNRNFTEESRNTGSCTEEDAAGIRSDPPGETDA